ncbi:hypothetical protein PVK06_043982 [Gossypium arboreum]|uniref:Dynamin stalk domain-containing protein n=1 Tax=Gossypium arboreum TaxID=29729 RepID=A0ABR0MPX6_GOSAR|nr:hypothetical protein PVK06_043982 [Gossypium arboreum]
MNQLDIMDRGTDARNLLLEKVIPLRLGYIGVVNRSQEYIFLNRSINDALVVEEKFFHSRPVYNGLADRCGVPQLAKKLNQVKYLQDEVFITFMEYNSISHLLSFIINISVEVDPCEGLTDDDIRNVIQRSSSIYSWLIRWLLEY